MGKITVIFNNIEADTRLQKGWGASTFVEHDGQAVLYDTGPLVDFLINNLETLKISKTRITKIALSHYHLDHAGALRYFMQEQKGRVELFVPERHVERISSVARSCAKEVHEIRDRKEMVPGVHFLIIKGLFDVEGVVVVDTHKGLIVLVGCAHAGIVNICKTAKNAFGKNVYAVFGGFHFEFYPPLLVKMLGYSLKKLGVGIIGPNHCTGDGGMDALRRVYGEGFRDFGGGRSFEF